MSLPERSSPRTVESPRSSIVFAVRGTIARADVTRLCDDLHGRLDHTDAAAVVVCDVRLVRPDVVAVDALARLQLTARRRGRRVQLRNASPELRELIAFAGLCAALP